MDRLEKQVQGTESSPFMDLKKMIKLLSGRNVDKKTKTIVLVNELINWMVVFYCRSSCKNGDYNSMQIRLDKLQYDAESNQIII